MNDFDYFTVLLSFIVSLGVTTLLAAVARLAQESHRVVFSWRHALWAAAIFNLQISFWIKSWSYRNTYEMHISTAVPPLLLAITAFLACGLATPAIPDGPAPIDLKVFHDANGRKYAITFAVFMVLAIIQGALFVNLSEGENGFATDAIAQSAFAALAVAAAVFQRQRWLQLGVPIVLLAGSIGYYQRLIGW